MPHRLTWVRTPRSNLNKGVLHGSPGRGELNGNGSIFQVNLQQRERDAHLPMSLDKEPQRHDNHSDVGSPPEGIGIHRLGQIL